MVVVRQWPCGALASRRWPRGASYHRSGYAELSITRPVIRIRIAPRPCSAYFVTMPTSKQVPLHPSRSICRFP